MDERMLSERQAFRAARYFLEQFNERERSEVLTLLIHWMDFAPDRITNDPAQWSDWLASVDRALAEPSPSDEGRGEASE